MISVTKGSGVNLDCQDKSNLVQEPIAIIGISGLTAQSPDLEVFWKNLESGRELITEIPEDRWKWEDYYGDPIKEENKTKVKWGGFIGDVDKFDAEFFGILPQEAQLIDPRERIFMEIVWKAIEDAGYKASDLSGTKTGVFVGVTRLDYREVYKESLKKYDKPVPTEITYSTISNRIAKFFNFTGPSVSFPLACASSMAAVHFAANALNQGDCNFAIAGGVNLLLNPWVTIALDRAGVLSRDGKMRPFNRDADGLVRAEGAGVIFLKLLQNAERDGDHIYAVIKGSAVGAGGRGISSITSIPGINLEVPNPAGHFRVMVSACKKGNIHPQTISYIEPQLTATFIENAAEINSLLDAFFELNRYFDKQNLRTAYCGLGSLKPNIGHLEGASGIMAILKVILSMKHRKLPADISFDKGKLNPYMKIKDSPFYILEEIREWKQMEDQKGEVIPRRAGINNYNLLGGHTYIVLEEFSSAPRLDRGAAENKYMEVSQIIVLSAKNEERLKEYAKELLDFLTLNYEPITLNLADLAYTLQAGREEMEERIAVVVKSKEELIKKLKSYYEGEGVIDGLWRGRVEKKKDRKKMEENRLIMEEGDLKKIAEMWVGGEKLDWKLLYKGGVPKKISLPTYPFAKTRYWLTDPQLLE